MAILKRERRRKKKMKDIKHNESNLNVFAREEELLRRTELSTAKGTSLISLL